MASRKNKPKERNNYHTPLLRLVFYLFRFSGLQVQAIDDGTLGGVANLLWNLAVDGLVFYGLTHLHFEEPFLKWACFSENNGRRVSPLFALFARYSLTITRPVCFSLTVLYYFLAGRKILALLDSPPFTTVYTSPRHARMIMASVVLTSHLTFFGFLAFNRDSLQSMSSRVVASWSDIGLFFYSLYMVNMYQYSVCLVLHYYQHATAVILHRISKQLSSLEGKEVKKVALSVERQCLEKMIALAHLNARLNEILSLPLLFYILMNGSQVTVAICFSLICKPNLPMLANSLSLWVYLLFLAILNEANRRAANRIFAFMRRRYQKSAEEDSEELPQRPIWARRRTAASKLRQWTPKWWSYTHSSDGDGDSSSRGKTPQDEVRRMIKGGGGRLEQRALRLQQADLYQSYFTIKMFHFAWLGLPFLFQVVLFIANNVLLMTQTQ